VRHGSYETVFVKFDLETMVFAVTVHVPSIVDIPLDVSTPFPPPSQSRFAVLDNVGLAQMQKNVFPSGHTYVDRLLE
jgi:hypothetical protein